MDNLTTLWWVPLAWAAGAALLWGVTWIVYLAGMAVLWSAGRFPPDSLTARLVVPVQRAGGVFSTALNWMVFTIVLLEWPKERYLSARLVRHVRAGSGWRWRIAMWAGRHWLDPFDPAGTHVGATHHGVTPNA